MVDGRRSGPLRCPSCEARLVEVERSDILIDACPECRGVWLDRGELDKILVRERAISAQDPDEDFFREVQGQRPRPAERPSRPERYEDDRYRKKRKRRSLLEELLDFD